MNSVWMIDKTWIVCELSTDIAFNKATNGQTDNYIKHNSFFSTLDLSEGGSFAIFNSDIQLSVFPFCVLDPFAAFKVNVCRL